MRGNTGSLIRISYVLSNGKNTWAGTLARVQFGTEVKALVSAPLNLGCCVAILATFQKSIRRKS
jgi:hypothetical protein